MNSCGGNLDIMVDGHYIKLTFMLDYSHIFINELIKHAINRVDILLVLMKNNLGKFSC